MAESKTQEKKPEEKQDPKNGETGSEFPWNKAIFHVGRFLAIYTIIFSYYFNQFDSSTYISFLISLIIALIWCGLLGISKIARCTTRVFFLELISPYGIVALYSFANWTCFLVPMHKALNALDDMTSINATETEKIGNLGKLTSVNSIIQILRIIHYIVPLPILILFMHSFLYVLLSPSTKTEKGPKGVFFKMFKELLKQLRGYIVGICTGMTFIIFMFESLIIAARNLVFPTDQKENSLFLLPIIIGISLCLMFTSIFSKRIMKFRRTIINDMFPSNTIIVVAAEKGSKGKDEKDKEKKDKKDKEKEDKKAKKMQKKMVKKNEKGSDKKPASVFNSRIFKRKEKPIVKSEEKVDEIPETANREKHIYESIESIYESIESIYSSATDDSLRPSVNSVVDHSIYNIDGNNTSTYNIDWLYRK